MNFFCLKALLAIGLFSLIFAKSLIPLSKLPYNYCEYEQTCGKAIKGKLAKFFGKNFNFKSLTTVLSYAQPFVTLLDKDASKEKLYFDLDVLNPITTANKAHLSAAFISNNKVPIKRSVVLGDNFETSIIISKLNDNKESLEAGSLGLLFAKKAPRENVNFLRKLKKDNVISYGAFSLYLNGDEINAAKNDLPESHILLGDKDDSLLEDSHNFKLINFKDGLITLDAVEFSQEHLVINSTKTSMTINLRSSSIGVPKVVYDQMMKILNSSDLQCGLIINKTVCVNSKNVQEGLEKISFPSLILSFDEILFTITKENLFSKCEKIKYGNGKEAAACELRIEVTEDYQLGAPFFYEYYSYFDMEKSVLVAGKARTKQKVTKDDNVSGTVTVIEAPEMGWEMKLLLVVFIVCLFAGVYLYKKHGSVLYSNVNTAAAQKANSIDSSDVHADFGPSINYRDPKARAAAATEYDDHL